MTAGPAQRALSLRGQLSQTLALPDCAMNQQTIYQPTPDNQWPLESASCRLLPWRRRNVTRRTLT